LNYLITTFMKLLLTRLICTQIELASADSYAAQMMNCILTDPAASHHQRRMQFKLQQELSCLMKKTMR